MARSTVAYRGGHSARPYSKGVAMAQVINVQLTAKDEDPARVEFWHKGISVGSVLVEHAPHSNYVIEVCVTNSPSTSVEVLR